LIFEEVVKIICFVSLPFYLPAAGLPGVDRQAAGIGVSNINGFSQNENGNNYLSYFGLNPNT